MTCTAAQKQRCLDKGLKCNPATKRCRKDRLAEAARVPLPRRSPSPRRSPAPSSSLIAGAVLANVGSQTAASLVSKRRSSQLGAGMPTMVEKTKKELRKSRKSPTRKSARKASPKRRILKDKAPRVKNTLRFANWSQSKKKGVTGIPRPDYSGSCSTGCTNPKRPVQLKSTCKCYSATSDVLRRQGVCLPRVGRDGKVYETVAVQGKRDMKCVKAGGQKAKATLRGAAACPEGKVLTTTRQTKQVPVKRGNQWVMGPAREYTVRRCIKAKGQHKDCPVNQVLVEFPGGRRCVLPKTAAKKGYQVVKRGTMPMKQYRVAMSPGR